MLEMFTEAIVLSNQCASIWIFMVYFEGGVLPFFVFCIIPFLYHHLDLFFCVCTGIIDFCSRYASPECDFTDSSTSCLVQCAPGCVAAWMENVFHLPGDMFPLKRLSATPL